jgi:hypothetical protein
MPESATIITRPPKVSFTLDKVEPPSPLYIGPDDKFWIRLMTASGGETFFVYGRLLRADGTITPLQWQFSTPNAFMNYWFTRPLTEGFLLSVVVLCVTTLSKRGNCFVRAGIGTGPDTAFSYEWVLISDYATAEQWLTWPGSQLRGFTDGAGLLRAFGGTDPAAGAESSEPVPLPARWRLRAWRASLTTSGVAGNRNVVLTLDDGGWIFAEFECNFNQTAGSTIIYTASAAAYSRSGQAGRAHIAIPPDQQLFGGCRIRTVTAGLDAGDNWSQPELFIEQWLDI